MKFINERQCHIIFWTFYSALISAFFFFISIKAVFVLVSNYFWKCFSVNADVWLRMENKFFRKHFQLSVCFSGFDPEIVYSENFHFKPFLDSCAKRERERERERGKYHVFDFAPIMPSTSHRSHPRIAPRQHRSHWDRTTQSHRSHRLHWERTLGSHWDRTDLSLSWSSVAILRWPNLKNFFFYWVLFLCLSIEKLYYIFVWKLRKCEKNVRSKKKMCFLYYF